MNLPDLIKNDPWLEPYQSVIIGRKDKTITRKKDLTGEGTLRSFASGHLFFGLHKHKNRWILREWAPNATAIYLIGTFNSWQRDDAFRYEKKEHGKWEITLDEEILSHGDRYNCWLNGTGDGVSASLPGATGLSRIPKQRYTMHRSGFRKNPFNGKIRFQIWPVSNL